MRVGVTLACSECKRRNYTTNKNKKNNPDRIELNKYCPFCKKHTLHKETKYRWMSHERKTRRKESWLFPKN